MSVVMLGIAVLIIGNILAIVLGYYLSVRLPTIATIFNQKPFNCRPCTTFHLSWIISGLFALITSLWILFVTGLAIAFIIFFILRFVDNKKIVE